MTSIIQILTLEPRQHVSLATLFTHESFFVKMHPPLEHVSLSSCVGVNLIIESRVADVELARIDSDYWSLRGLHT